MNNCTHTNICKYAVFSQLYILLDNMLVDYSAAYKNLQFTKMNIKFIINNTWWGGVY
jgi:hypothetical protein